MYRSTIFLSLISLLLLVFCCATITVAQSSDEGPIPPPLPLGDSIAPVKEEQQASPVDDLSLRDASPAQPEEEQLVDDDMMITDPIPCYWGGDSEEEVPEHSRNLHAAYMASLEEKESKKRFSFMGGSPYRWTKTATNPTGRSARGQPITVTWSIVPDGTPISNMLGGSESTSSSNLRAFLRGIYGTDQAAINAFQGFFNEWASISGLTFVYEPNDDKAAMSKTSLPSGILGVRADMRIGGHPIDGGSGTLAYTYNPNWGDMVIDTADSFYTTKTSLIRNVMTHEIGHGIGFSHVCPGTKTKLMEPFVTSNFLGLQDDEKRGVHFLYGDEFEENDSQAAAKSLGTLSSSLTRNGLSLERGSSDDDYFSFVVGSSLTSVTITVTPSGSTALSTANYATTCPSTTVNALSQFNLNFQVIQASTGSSLATVAAAGNGLKEVKTLRLTQGQKYYIRVYTPDAISSTTEYTDKKVQLYNLSITATA
jgi:hypothetical protein